MKIEILADAWLYPLPAILLGATVHGKPNYSTIGNCGIITVEPPCVYVSSQQAHYTNIGIREHQAFSLNIPSTAMVKVTDYCGMTSGRLTDKTQLFTTFYGKLGVVPMIEECPINLECRVTHQLEMHGMEVFFGEVVAAFANADCLTAGSPDIAKVDPIIYAFAGNYWSLGREIGKAFTVEELPEV